VKLDAKLFQESRKAKKKIRPSVALEASPGE